MTIEVSSLVMRAEQGKWWELPILIGKLVVEFIKDLKVEVL